VVRRAHRSRAGIDLPDGVRVSPKCAAHGGPYGRGTGCGPTACRAMASALASALYAQAEPGFWRLQMAYLEFTDEFVDGTCVSTHNGTTLSAFAKAPGREVAQFPHERDPFRLYRLHRAMVRLFGSPAARRPRGARSRKWRRPNRAE